MWSGTALYVAYAPGEAYWNISATADQGTAGVIMMVEGGLITLGALAWALLRWASRDAEKQRLLELAAERGVPLTPERAERAVTAGHGARLEERISGAEGQTHLKANRFLYLTVFTVGISTLGAEIAAARLLAPFFGASTIVWANTIGVVLVALSLGYWYGGKLGDRYPELTKLCQVVIGGAVLLPSSPSSPSRSSRWRSRRSTRSRRARSSARSSPFSSSLRSHLPFWAPSRPGRSA